MTLKLVKFIISMVEKLNNELELKNDVLMDLTK